MLGTSQNRRAQQEQRTLLERVANATDSLHSATLMRLSNISKSFGRARALDDVSFQIEAAEIVGLIGENGAGKTTLMRIAGGELAPDSGEVARAGRVSLVHQHFMLASELTIAENLALLDHATFRIASRREMQRTAERVVSESGISLPDVTRRAGDLSVGEKSKLELIKAIVTNPATLILDEPTSVLTPTEAAELFDVVRTIASRGTAVVFVSHKLPEVMAVAQRIVVMRGGRVVAERRTADTTPVQLADLMVVRGSASAQNEQPGATPGEIALTYDNLAVHSGEIVAIVGVAGNGQSELAATLRARLDRNTTAHVPEDRTRDGIVAEMTIAENLALRSTRWRPRDASRHAEEMIRVYSIRAGGPSDLAGQLSGGNQQKVILARELGIHPRVIVAAEPTRGLDVEATRFIHRQLRAAVHDGAALLLITSDLDEAFALADAIHVIYRGRLSDRMTNAEATSRVAALMAGVA